MRGSTCSLTLGSLGCQALTILVNNIGNDLRVSGTNGTSLRLYSFVGLLVVPFAQVKDLPLILMGHSQGVNFVTQLANDPTLSPSGLVLAAGLGNYSISETIVRQFETHLKNPNLPEEKKRGLTPYCPLLLFKLVRKQPDDIK